MTRNAVLTSPEHRVKVSLRSPLMLPTVALVDPELTYGLPPAITASTGMDALAQLIEPFVCSRANPATDSLCMEGMRRVTCSLRKAFAGGPNDAARLDMAIASLFGGMALANAGLGAVHGLAGPIGGMFRSRVARRRLRGLVAARGQGQRLRYASARAEERGAGAVRTRRGAPHGEAQRYGRSRGRVVAATRNRPGYSAAGQLRHHRRARAGSGGEGRRRQQHAGESDHPDCRRVGRHS